MFARGWVRTYWLLFANAVTNKPNPSLMDFLNDLIDSLIFSTTRLDSLFDSVNACNMFSFTFQSPNPTSRKFWSRLWVNRFFSKKLRFLSKNGSIVSLDVFNVLALILSGTVSLASPWESCECDSMMKYYLSVL